MADEHRREAEALTAADQAEVASAREVVQAFVKAARGFAIYLPNNPLHGKFFADLRERTLAHLDTHGRLRLEVGHESLACLGETVYTSADLRENLAFRMYADGIRALLIEAGLEEGELRSLVDILGRPPQDEAEDDIATRLWAAELPHVRHLLADVPAAAGPAALGLPAPPPGAQEAGLRRALAAPREPAPPPAPLPAQIFTLTEAEVLGLQEAVEREAQRTPIEDVTVILTAILRAERDPALFDEFLEILGRLCSDLLLTGRLHEVLALLEILRRLDAEPGLDQPRRARIAETRRGVVSEEALARLEKTLEGADAAAREDLRGLVRLLGEAAVGPFCTLLGAIQGKEVRKVLVEALAEVGRDAPERFFPYLEDERWYLVRNTVHMLRRIGSPRAAPAVRSRAGHRDARVRKEVLLFFEEVADPGAEAVLLRFLEDEAPALRVGAARGLARRRSRAGRDRLLALASGPRFEELELTERTAVCEALGELDPAAALGRFREMLRRRHWFNATRGHEAVVCAVAGLKRIGSPAARAALQEAAAAKKGRERALIEDALRALARAGRGTATPEAATPGEDGGLG